MGGTSFALKGSAGAVPITAFMPPIPSRFTLLIPAHLGGPAGGSTFGVQYDAQIAAKNVNQWAIFDASRDGTGSPSGASCTFGATVTAPDGTATATHLVETAVNGYHQTIAAADVFQNTDGNSQGQIITSMRLGVIAKAAERSRIKLTIMGQNLFGGTANWDKTGCIGSSTIFDLAGGQIGVANTAFNGVNANAGSGLPIPGQASISPLGNGWQLCTMDVSFYPPGFTMQYIICTVTIDSGSGTGAENTSYLGDVTKGVNVWTSSLLPKAAWAMSGFVEFNDDFTSLSTIDVNNTKQAGFNWYLGNFKWFAFASAPIPPPSNFSISSSILTMAPFAHPSLYSAYPISDGVWGGYTFRLPALIEFKWKVDYPNNSNLRLLDTAVWSLGMFMLSHDSSLNPITGQNAAEFDFSEIAGAIGADPLGSASMVNWQKGGGQWQLLPSWAGYQKWFSNYLYDQNPPAGGAGDTAGEGNAFYISLVTNNLGNDPASTVGVDWNVQQTGVTTITLADATQLNTYATLLLPPSYNGSGYDSGYHLTFFNGVPCNTSRAQENTFRTNLSTINPAHSHYPNLYPMDSYPLLVSGGETTNGYIDFMRVTK